MYTFEIKLVLFCSVSVSDHIVEGKELQTKTNVRRSFYPNKTIARLPVVLIIHLSGKALENLHRN